MQQYALLSFVMPPITSSPFVTREVLLSLIQAQAVRRIMVERQADCWIINVALPGGDKVLQSSRDTGARLFRTLNGAIGTLDDLGVRWAEIDLGSRRPV